MVYLYSYNVYACISINCVDWISPIALGHVQSSPFCKIAREALSELELPHIYHRWVGTSTIFLKKISETTLVSLDAWRIYYTPGWWIAIPTSCFSTHVFHWFLTSDRLRLWWLWQLCSRKCKEGYTEAENRQIPGNATLPKASITKAFYIM